jgi:threonine/homoserine/homoserine lactone efflux protein
MAAPSTPGHAVTPAAAAGWDLPLASLLQFLGGYAVVLATPGPNMLAVAAVAALRGFAAAVPLCLGVACGVGMVAVALHAAFAAFPDAPAWGTAGRLIGAFLLGYAALRIAQLRCTPNGEGRGSSAAPASNPPPLAGFLAGFCTAATNPITAAYLAAGLTGPLAVAPHAAPIALLGVSVEALVVNLIVAVALARPAARRAALVWQRTICVGVAALLVASAAAAVRPLAG